MLGFPTYFVSESKPIAMPGYQQEVRVFPYDQAQLKALTQMMEDTLESVEKAIPLLGK